MGIRAGLNNHHLLIGVTLPSRSNRHLEITKDFEASRLLRIDRKKCGVNVGCIRSTRVAIGQAKQIAKHLDRRCRDSVGIRAKIAILNNHNSQGDRRVADSLLLQMKAKIQILELDAFSNNVIHLSPLLHCRIQNWIHEAIITDADGGQTLETCVCDEKRVVVLLDLRREAPVDRGDLRT